LFLDPYLQLADILLEDGKTQYASALAREAYERALSIIADADGKWPERMPWSWLENRHILRALFGYADMIWHDGQTQEALEIYRKILKMNPNDNQGVRYSILALRLGLGPSWQDKFMVEDAGVQDLNAEKRETWFTHNARKFPEEFDRLFAEWNKNDSL
jgi:tetratricopeptide (TPR) repeat protein